MRTCGGGGYACCFCTALLCGTVYLRGFLLDISNTIYFVIQLNGNAFCYCSDNNVFTKYSFLMCFTGLPKTVLLP